MIIKILVVSTLLLVIAGLGFGIGLFFNKKTLPAGSCQRTNDIENEFRCGCAGEECIMKNEK